MPGNVFSTSRTGTSPPPYCKKPPEDLPPIIPPDGPATLQAYATWLDHDPEAYNSCSMFTYMYRVGSAWAWMGEEPIRTFVFRIELSRMSDPQPWLCTLSIYGDPKYAGSVPFDPFEMQLEPSWDSGHLTRTMGPLYDKITARITG